MTRMCLAAMTTLLAACASPAMKPEPGLGRLGETVAAGPVKITPRALLEDSRCPQAVRCVWQGRVRLDTLVNGVPHELTLGQPLPVAGGALMLAEVRPARQPEAEIAAADYRFRFAFTR